MSQPPHPQSYQQSALPGCWWHPDRQTGLRCARCDRPACPACLRDAPVGYQCVDCVHAGQQQARAQQRHHRRLGLGQRTVAGARASSVAVVTPLLILLNVLVFVLTVVQSGSVMENQFSQAFQDGVLIPLTVAFDGEWWRLISSGFLHYGLLHLAMNMLALWILGRDLELLLGKLRYTALYFVSMLGGAAAVFLFSEVDTWMAGASGAVYGLMGGVAVAVFRLRLNPAPALGVIALNLVLSVSIPNISLLGHLGGLVVGVLFGAALLYAPERRRAVYQTVAGVLLTAALVAAIVTRDAQLSNQVCTLQSDKRVVCVDR